MNGEHGAGFTRARWRRIGVLVAGWSLLATGAVLLFLPGPGLPLLLGGLALLGREAAWARRLERRILRWFKRGRPQEPAETPPPLTVRKVT
jgi:hypothetical protein